MPFSRQFESVSTCVTVALLNSHAFPFFDHDAATEASQYQEHHLSSVVSHGVRAR